MKNSPFSIKTHKWLKTLIKTISPSNPTSTINSYLFIYGSIYFNSKNRRNVVDLVNTINTVQN